MDQCSYDALSKESRCGIDQDGRERGKIKSVCGTMNIDCIEPLTPAGEL